MRRLAERGVDAATIARLTCPIGVAGIAGREPEVIAAAVVAQLLVVASAAVTTRLSPAATVDPA